MRHSRFFNMLVPDTKVHIIIIGILVGIISIYNKYIGLVGIILLGYLFYYNYKNTNIIRAEWTRYIEGLSSEIDSATGQSILNMPIPLTMIEIDGTIKWYNKRFLEIVNNQRILDENIEKIVPGFKLSHIRDEKLDTVHVKVDDKHFKLMYNIIKTNNKNKSNYIIMLYWIDETDYEELKKEHYEKELVVALVQADNLDEVMQDTEETKRPLLIAEIDHKIGLWVKKIQGFVKKYENDKFIIVFERKFLEELEDKKFDILDEIREIDMGNKIPITLSMGIGTGGMTPLENAEFANASKDLSLGRGGDQATVKKNEKISFYGGRTKAVEKRTKVKARVISHALRQLMEQSENVFVMGHVNADLDALGSALGIYRAARNRKKTAYIVLEGNNSGIDSLYKKIIGKEEYKNILLNCEQAISKIERGSLLVVVDTHRPSFTACPELLKRTENIVVIDHHRKGTEFIDNTVLDYHETYVSSTSELVTEILFYMDDKISVEKIEAEALLAGIAIDTKNFTFRTGVRTFEAAALLRRAGADMTNVKQLFQNDMATILARAEVIQKAKRFKDNIVISVCDENMKVSQLVVAQGADELLEIKDVEASFVLARKSDTMVIISGRSMGDINVQVILEKLGGGGHLTLAGAQLENINIEEARKQLEMAIEEYFQEEEE
ncbi:MAG: phosphoesterase [Clostridiales bacterium]|nr:phosphoesterase [Clostridiales bacterium]